jgi:hypothetical protein
VAEIVPPHPADGLGLGSPAVSATTALPIPWEPAIEPTPTPLPHPVKIDNAWRNLQKIAPIVERTATGVRESTDRILLLSYDRSIFVDADV